VSFWASCRVAKPGLSLRIVRRPSARRAMTVDPAIVPLPALPARKSCIQYVFVNKHL
jgi:hypothetical protein